MDSGASTHRDFSSRGEVCGFGGAPQGIPVRARVLELSDALDFGAGDISSPATADKVRCRQILVELLAPLGAEAGDWADSLVDRFGSLAAILAAEPNALART